MISATTHILPFESLSALDFERLCLALLRREGFPDPQHYGAAGSDAGRDIIARRDDGLWYVQCKQVKECGAQLLLNEVNKIQRLIEGDPEQRPVGILFMVSCNVSAQARDRVASRCSELGLECETWGRTDLDSRVQESSDLVARFFDWYAHPAGAPFQAPPLPPHFVSRPKECNELKEHLLAYESGTRGTLAISAIHGMGGIGKSVLAAALAHDAEIQRAFPDGVLWIVLGQQPELLARLRECIQALGDHSFVPTTVEGGSVHLRSLLHTMACLVIVDDAWQADDVCPFLVGGPACKILVTTRDAALARKVGARLYAIDVMTETEALLLFEARLGSLEGDRPKAASLARDLGYLPLALELASAQIDAGVHWMDLQACFRQGLVDLQVLDLDEAGFRNESLRLSFHLSLHRLSADDLDAFAWLGVLPEDAQIGAGMAAMLWNQRETEADKRLRRFRDRGLLRSVGSNLYLIHDLLHEEAKLRLMERMSLPEAHLSLLARYRQAARQPDQWHTLPDDGYIYSHLAWHLVQAGDETELHDLLAEQTVEGRNGWHEARERLGQGAGYLNDIARAWSLAVQSDSLPLQIRYATIESTVHSLAQQLPIQLFSALFKYGSNLMPGAVVLDKIKQLPRWWQRADALHELAACIPVELFADALDFAIGLARENERGLVGLAPYLPAGLLEVALRRLPTESREAGQYLFFQAVAPNLPDQLLELGLDVARRLSQPGSRAVALSCLTPRLQGHLIETVVSEAVEAVSDLDCSPELRARTLFYLAPNLTPAQIRTIWQRNWASSATWDKWNYDMGCPWLAQAYQKAGMLDEMFDLLKRTRLEDYLFEAIKQVAPRLSKELLPNLVGCLPTDRRGFGRPQSLGILAQYGTAELQRDVLRITRTDHYDSASGLIALATIAPYLDEEETRISVLEELRALLHKCNQSSCGWNRWEIDAYRLVVDLLPSELVSMVVEQTRRGSGWQTIALESLESLPDAHRKTICVELVAMAEDNGFNWDMLIKLSPHLAPREREHLLALALQHTRLVNDLDEYDPLTPYRASATKTCPNRARYSYFRERDHVRVLLAMVPHSAEPIQAADLALEALSRVEYHRLADVNTEEVRCWLPALNDEQRTSALSFISDVGQSPTPCQDVEWHDRAVIHAASQLLAHIPLESRRLVGQLLWRQAQEASPQSLRVLLLSLAADHLNESQAIAAEEEVSRWLDSQPVMSLEGSDMPFAAFLTKVLDVLQGGCEYDVLRTGASTVLRHPVFTETMREFSKRVEYHKDRPHFLIRLAAVWAHLPVADLYQVFQSVLPLLATGDRKQFLWDLHAMAPIVLKLGGEEAMQATIDEVERVMRWWP